MLQGARKKPLRHPCADHIAECVAVRALGVLRGVWGRSPHLVDANAVTASLVLEHLQVRCEVTVCAGYDGESRSALGVLGAPAASLVEPVFLFNPVGVHFGPMWLSSAIVGPSVAANVHSLVHFTGDSHLEFFSMIPASYY